MPHYIVQNPTSDAWGHFSARAERLDVAARGESLAAFAGRCIPAGGARLRPVSNAPGLRRGLAGAWRRRIAPRSHTPGRLGRRAWPAGRLARLGATPDFHRGLLAVRCAEPEKRVVYDYVVHNLVTGRTLRRGPATPEAIEKEGGELIPETRREVDESEIDDNGFVRRKEE